MRRLLNAIHATFKNRISFDSRRFYILTKAAAD